MRVSILTKLFDYLPALVAFVASLFAIVGNPKWDHNAVGWAKITFDGWVVIAIGVAALTSSLIIVRRNHREQEKKQEINKQITSLAIAQLDSGVQRIIGVFMQSSFWPQKLPEPQSPIEMLSADRRKVLAGINLNGLSNYANGKGYVHWWYMFQCCANEGAAQITSALQIYVTYLDPKIVSAATKLLDCFFMNQLQNIHEIVNANTRTDPDREVPFFWASPDGKVDSNYEEFWHLVVEFKILCKSE